MLLERKHLCSRACTLCHALRKGPWLCADHFTLAVCPEVNSHSDNVVDGRVGCLVHQDRGEDRDGEEDQASFNGSVDGGTGEDVERPLHGEHEQSKEEVEYL